MRFPVNKTVYNQKKPQPSRSHESVDGALTHEFEPTDQLQLELRGANSQGLELVLGGLWYKLELVRVSLCALSTRNFQFVPEPRAADH